MFLSKSPTYLRLPVCRLLLLGVLMRGEQLTLALTGPNVIAWGDNTYGQTNVPTDLTNAVAIAAGFSHSLALRADGTVISWGDNTYGQTNVPAGLSNVVAISAGGWHDLALRSDSTIVTWGEFINMPSGLSNVMAVVAGESHDIALREDGTLVAWGTNAQPVPWGGGTLDYGATNIPGGLENITAFAAGDLYTLALHADGTVFAWGSYIGFEYWYPMDVPSGLSNVVTISAGGEHALALSSDGKITQWGDDHVLQLLNFPISSNVTAIAGGGYHSLALQPDGGVLAWGFNNAGQTKVPAGLSNVVDIAAGGHHSLALVGTQPRLQPRPVVNRSVAREAGSAIFYAPAATGWALSYQWQRNGTNVPGATNAWFIVTNTSADQAGVYSVTTTNTWGIANTLVGQLNVAPATFSLPPQDQVMYLGGTATFLVAVQGVGPLSYQWRFNGAILGGETNSSLSLSNLTWDRQGSYSITVSNHFGSVISSNARLDIVNVAGWGLNNDWPYVYKGQATAPVGLTNAVAVAAGHRHSLALRADGTVLAWGANTSGEANVPGELSNVVAIGTANVRNLALRSDGTVVGWGTGTTNVPADLTNAVAIALGRDHNLVLRADGTVTAWGANDAGQTNVPAGLSNVVAIAAGDQHNLVLRADGSMLAWGQYGRWNPLPPPIGYDIVPMTVPNSLTDIVAIASGSSHCLALEANGKVLAWGDNRFGQTNVHFYATYDVVAISAGRFHSLALQVDPGFAWFGPFFTVVGWGENSSGQAIVRSDLTNVLAITAGDSHNLALIGTAPLPKQLPLSSAGFSNNVFRVSLPTQSGRVYRLEFKNSLEDISWAVMPLVAGIGGVQTLTDLTATNTSRFYRVRQW